MAELRPVPFADLVERLHLECERQDAIFDLPRRKWYVPPPGGLDLSVQFHGRRAANPAGPASGPHTQMAQNIVLSWLAGARIIEFKTVQINDRLTIPRPCIDMANVGYNVEWSQELRIAESAREYVAGAMLVHMLRQGQFFENNALAGAAGETIYDLSVGYDLAGIQSKPVREFFDCMRDASSLADGLRAEIPLHRRHLRDLDYPTRISTSVTLSTFHGCPADEIEQICEFLLGELGVDVVVKMNPPMLGRERLEHLLHDVLGYTEITVNPSAYTSGLQFEEAVAMCRRLADLAAKRRRHFGAKFSNTLEVVNHRQFFTPDSKVMYLSGQPLHVITLALADAFRQDVGPELPFSFSAGVDRRNFADMVACGFCPVTTCTDLLRTGGYGRLANYLNDLTERMRAIGARTIGDFILDARRQRESARGDVRAAAAANLRVAATEAATNERYRAANNRATPKRLGSELALFDCISCDKCIPVCPNDANFVYELPIQRLEFHDWVVGGDGTLRPSRPGSLNIERKHQIASFADFCNDCGNCDTFCPELGGPFARKPNFVSSAEALKASPRDAFCVEAESGVRRIRGQIDKREYVVEQEIGTGEFTFADGRARIRVVANRRVPELLGRAPVGHVIDMRAFHTLRLLLQGILDARRVNQVNVRTALSGPAGT